MAMLIIHLYHRPSAPAVRNRILITQLTRPTLRSLTHMHFLLEHRHQTCIHRRRRIYLDFQEPIHTLCIPRSRIRTSASRNLTPRGLGATQDRIQLSTLSSPSSITRDRQVINRDIPRPVLVQLLGKHNSMRVCLPRR